MNTKHRTGGAGIAAVIAGIISLGTGLDVDAANRPSPDINKRPAPAIVVDGHRPSPDVNKRPKPTVVTMPCPSSRRHPAMHPPPRVRRGDPRRLGDGTAHTRDRQWRYQRDHQPDADDAEPPMSIHPDTAARAAAVAHLDRIANAQQAAQINQAQRQRSTQQRRPPLLDRITRLVTVHRRGVRPVDLRRPPDAAATSTESAARVSRSPI
jgi:hypothetical protein